MPQYTESDLLIPALQALDSAGGTLSTSALIQILQNQLQPEGHDAEILDGRNDTHFSQKVRNLVSHRAGGNSPIARGLINYDEDTHALTITDAGRDYLLAAA